MCTTPNESSIDEAIGSYDKRGDGQVQFFPILVAVCSCQKNYVARVKNNHVWVEAEADHNHSGLHAFIEAEK